MNLPTVVFVVPAAVAMLSWLGIGVFVPARWLPGPGLPEALLRIGFGATVFAVGAFLLGLVGLFESWLLVGLTAGFAFLGLRPALVLARWARLPEHRAARLLLALTALALVVDIVASAVPATSADAVKYHLAVPERWLELGQIDEPWWNWQGFSPFGIEMLYAQGLALGGSEVAGAIGAFFAALGAAAVYALARELGGGEVAASAAAALFVLQGLTTWEATSAFVELGMSFYVALAAWCALALRRDAVPSLAGWAGFCCGAAAGTKFIGLLPAALVLAGAAVAARRSLPRLAPYLVFPALLAGGAWYLRNAFATGNPFYPLFFGGKGWGADDDLLLEGLDGYGTGSILRLPLLPLDLLLNGDEFDRGRYVSTGIFVFAAAALILRPRRDAAAVWLAVAAFGVVWWEGSAQARFLLPALAALAALGGVGVEELVRRSGWWSRGAVLVLAAVVAAWAASTAALTRQLLPPALGLESRDDALQRLTGTYDAMVDIHERVGDEVVAFAGYSHTYPYPGPAISLNSSDFGPAAPRPHVLARLGAYRVRYVVAPRFDQGVPQMRPLEGCLRRVADYDARFVTSRSLAESVPFPLVLYELQEECRR